MQILLIIAVSVTLAKGSSTPTLCRHQVTPDGHPLLTNLLQVASYTGTCMAAALDYSSVQEDGHFAALMEVTSHGFFALEVSQVVNKWEFRPRHCKDLLDSGDSGSGLRQVYPYPGLPYHRVTVYCDHTVDGGGWTVFQRRTNDSLRQDFDRKWIEYQLGFGDLQGEFWLGLDVLHELTSKTLQELRIDLDDYEGGHRWAKYGLFHVGGPDTHYRLNVGRYSGDAGDCLGNHNKAKFSTMDADHDTHASNCADVYDGGWWHTHCHTCHLNGYHFADDSRRITLYEGIHYRQWRGTSYSLKRTSMMIRPAF